MDKASAKKRMETGYGNGGMEMGMETGCAKGTLLAPLPAPVSESMAPPLPDSPPTAQKAPNVHLEGPGTDRYGNGYGKGMEMGMEMAQRRFGGNKNLASPGPAMSWAGAGLVWEEALMSRPSV